MSDWFSDLTGFTERSIGHSPSRVRENLRIEGTRLHSNKRAVFASFAKCFMSVQYLFGHKSIHTIIR